MHCERCNVDFPEGLRYCKWCGEALIDRPRVTSELHSCPSCAAAIQPGWTFCKACGERLQGAAKPGTESDAIAGKGAPDSPETAVITISCSACGERLDTGSLYCKGCGSAVYTEQKPFGGSALLCGQCKSYSPLGSAVCRVCGAPLSQGGARTMIDFPSGLTTVQEKPPTLPDLDEQMASQPPASTDGGEGTFDSGVSTQVFKGSKGDAQTERRLGTPEARPEQSAPTRVMKMGRTTGPVEPEESQEAPKPSGDLPASPSPESVPETSKDRIAADRTVEFAAISQTPTVPAGPVTLERASEKPKADAKSQPKSAKTDSVAEGSENKTAVFVSGPQDAAKGKREHITTDDIGSAPFAAEESLTGNEPTREFQAPQRRASSEQVAPTIQMPSTPPPLEAERADPVAPTIQMSSPPAQSKAEPRARPERRQPQAPPQVSSQPAPTKRTGVVIASVIVGLVLLGGAGYVGWLLFGRGTPTPPPVVVDRPQPAPPAVPEKPAAPAIPEGMVALAAGTYTIGRDGADPLEQPEHRVDLPPFFIDRTEVTNAAYKLFVDATGHRPPSNWTGTRFPEGRGDSPVTGVTWQDAADYAAWAGKRLPTEAEWEAAARGADGRIYPWGNGFRSGVANIGQRPDKPSQEQYPDGIKPGGRYPDGASPAGAVDMIGNAWEWVADEIKVYPGNTESKLELEPGVKYRVIRGGAYDGNKVNDATYRGYLDASLAYPKVGFRCVKDAR